MFGYVVPLRRELKVREWEDYQAAYCGLCHTLRATCGRRARYVLNYDFTFLALLLDDGSGTSCSKGCPAHPIKKRRCYRSDAAFSLAAKESVILARYKLLDSVRDEKGWKALAARLGVFSLRRAYRRASRGQETFAEHVAQCLTDLSELETQGSASLDRTADTFARLLEGAAPVTGRPERDRPMGQLLYHLGRWIYILDAYDDLQEDLAAKRYNPVAARFGGTPDEEYLKTTLRHSLSLCQSAFQLLEETRWHEILQNILYLGLPAVQEEVFAGTWRRTTKMSRSLS